MGSPTHLTLLRHININAKLQVYTRSYTKVGKGRNKEAAREHAGPTSSKHRYGTTLFLRVAANVKQAGRPLPPTA